MNQEIREAVGQVFMGFMEKMKADKIVNFSHMNKIAVKGETLFVGSSLMENFPINEMLTSYNVNKIIYNRGVGGAVINDLLNSMNECIFDLEPSKIFINIGTNDIGMMSYKKEELIENYSKVLTQIKEKLPETKVYVMAYYPVNAVEEFPGIDRFRKIEMFASRNNPTILEANIAVEELAKKFDYEFINVNEGLMDEDGNLKKEYAIEGVHIWANGYQVVFENIKKYL